MIEELDKCIESNKGQMVQSLCEIVGISSKYGRSREGASYGGRSRRILGFAIDLGKKLGSETVVNMGDRVYCIKYGIRIEVVEVSAHLDIVPEGDGWTYPPSRGEIHNDRVYDRGTVDNEGPPIASLYVPYVTKECGLSLGGYQIRIAGGTDERKDMDDMKYYVSQRGTPDVNFTSDGLFPMFFTERGVNCHYMSYDFSGRSTLKVRVLELHGGEILSMVPDRVFVKLGISNMAEVDRTMRPVEEYHRTTSRDATTRPEEDGVEITSRGLYVHSCTPFNGKNAIVAILILLADLGINRSVGAFLKLSAEKIGMTTDGSPLGMKREDECGKFTFSLSKMDVDEKGLTRVTDIRYPYTYKDQVTEDFTARVTPEGIVIHKADAYNIYRFLMDHSLIRTLRGVYEGLTGKDSAPSHEGGTYAQMVSDIVPSGSIFPGTPDLCHRPNEYTDIDEYVLGAKFFGNVAYALTKEDL